MDFHCVKGPSVVQQSNIGKTWAKPYLPLLFDQINKENDEFLEKEFRNYVCPCWIEHKTLEKKYNFNNILPSTERGSLTQENLLGQETPVGYISGEYHKFQITPYYLFSKSSWLAQSSWISGRSLKY